MCAAFPDLIVLQVFFNICSERLRLFAMSWVICGVNGHLWGYCGHVVLIVSGVWGRPCREWDRDCEGGTLVSC